jgi:hypothetical protein
MSRKSKTELEANDTTQVQRRRDSCEFLCGGVVDRNQEPREVVPAPKGIGAEFEPRHQVLRLSGEFLGYLGRHFDQTFIWELLIASIARIGPKSRNMLISGGNV